jgi:hypothetical protein
MLEKYFFIRPQVRRRVGRGRVLLCCAVGQRSGPEEGHFTLGSNHFSVRHMQIAQVTKTIVDWGQFLVSPQGATFDPRGEVDPWGEEVDPKGEHDPSGEVDP